MKNLKRERERERDKSLRFLHIVLKLKLALWTKLNVRLTSFYISMDFKSTGQIQLLYNQVCNFMLFFNKNYTLNSTKCALHTKTAEDEAKSRCYSISHLAKRVRLTLWLSNILSDLLQTRRWYNVTERNNHQIKQSLKLWM